MNEPDRLLDLRVTIVGLGLMGGSLAMALRGKCAGLVGVDCDSQVLSLACKKNLIDQSYERLSNSLAGCDLIILATPVNAILESLREMPDIHSGSIVVIDLGSTKVEITQAMQSLPKCFDPLGGHPMCGKERSSLTNADRDLFLGAPFALTSLPRTSTRARELAAQLVDAIGAYPLWIDPHTHDRWVAATSQLPYLIANVLAYITPQESKPLVGPGFRSTSRLAPSPPELMLDILSTNRANILNSIGDFRNQLETLEQAIRTNNLTGLKDYLSQGASIYDRLVATDNIR